MNLQRLNFDQHKAAFNLKKKTVRLRTFDQDPVFSKGVWWDGYPTWPEWSMQGCKL